MEQTWRWFRPGDPVPLVHVSQAGATGVVSALHEHYRGEVPPEEAITERKRIIEAAGLRCSVVESIPVPNAIKLDGEPARAAMTTFAETMRRLARAGPTTICYNFMPVVDWTRTELRHPMPSGGPALRFEMIDFVAYEVFILEPPDAEKDYSEDHCRRAEERARSLRPEEVQRLEATIVGGLPGAEDNDSRRGIAAVIARYHDMSPDDLRARLREFPEAVLPIAREVDVNLCIHPNDPPFALFGLPHLVSTAEDLEAIFGAVPECENGLTFCAGSFGARADNDLPAILSAWADRVHFIHLRNVPTGPDGSFVEDEHLTGNADMVGLLPILLREKARRQGEGREVHLIPFRPDHGHLLLDDQEKRTLSGYSAIGPLKGLAELRGILQALSHPEFGVLQ